MKMKIITQYVHPPIPVRCMDWQATYDDYDEGDPIGSGETEWGAVESLLDQADGWFK